MNVHLDRDEITALLQAEAFAPSSVAEALFLARITTAPASRLSSAVDTQEPVRLPIKRTSSTAHRMAARTTNYHQRS